MLYAKDKKGFELNHVGSVSGSLTRIRKEIVQELWIKELKLIEKKLFIV